MASSTRLEYLSIERIWAAFCAAIACGCLLGAYILFQTWNDREEKLLLANLESSTRSQFSHLQNQQYRDFIEPLVSNQDGRAIVIKNNADIVWQHGTLSTSQLCAIKEIKELGVEIKLCGPKTFPL